MQKVFLIDKKLTPKGMVHPAVVRILLKERKAFVYRRFPFVIRLGVVFNRTSCGLQLKLDPGSVTTGIALVNNQSGVVVWGAELTHRGRLIKKKLDARRALRRSRRNRNTRYRQPRFLNRTSRPDGWLPPSLMSRVFNIMTWIQRLRKFANITGMSLELVKFDMQAIQNPEVSGILYQQGELVGYEIREYLLEKFNRTCVYCGVKNVPLQVEHVIPKAKGGSNRVSNLTLACDSCNKAKGTLSIEEFLHSKPALLKKIKSQIKTPLKDAAAVNVTRWKLWRQLTALGLPIECGSGAVTKYNRTNQGLPKTHWLDAACVGKSTPVLKNTELVPLQIKASGHGSRQMCRTDKFGFPKRHCLRSKRRGVFQTGDMVCAIIPSGKQMGFHVGRLTTRVKPSFKVGNVDGIHSKYVMLKQRSDGYSYAA